ncbi:MAG: hypothetical protein ABSF99_02355 [Anaerolineales bacterium]|jgi:hypothetical protein
MLKNYFLFGILVIIGAMASSAFTFVSQKPVQNNAFSIVETSFRTPLTSNYAPAIAVTGFQTPITSNYAPAIVVTGFQTPLTSDYALSIAKTGFQTPQTSNYVGSISPIVQLAASQVGLSKALVTVDKGERDFVSLSSGLSGLVASEVGKFQSLAIGNTASVSSFPYIFSPYLIVVGQYVDDHYPVLNTFSPYLVVVPQYVDDHYPVLSSSYLTVVSIYHDR